MVIAPSLTCRRSRRHERGWSEDSAGRVADFGRSARVNPLTLRLTPEERVRLEELVAGMTLSADVRACVFAEDERARKRRPKDVVADRKAVAEALAFLGQSRIASNLNQLDYYANIGALIVGEAEKARIAEANAHLLAIRTLLMRGLGKRA